MNRSALWRAESPPLLAYWVKPTEGGSSTTTTVHIIYLSTTKTTAVQLYNCCIVLSSINLAIGSVIYMYMYESLNF